MRRQDVEAHASAVVNVQDGAAIRLSRDQGSTPSDRFQLPQDTAPESGHHCRVQNILAKVDGNTANRVRSEAAKRSKIRDQDPSWDLPTSDRKRVHWISEEDKVLRQPSGHLLMAIAKVVEHAGKVGELERL
ncbi:hypothetical protein PRIPAC_94086, partial [Pristionchus pacificus]|uniref:Uncharacterized protein n=1 Tax=Pristionchus pacificus TaxID=54126 RepID=A0A2A6CE14_PRIPA